MSSAKNDGPIEYVGEASRRRRQRGKPDGSADGHRPTGSRRSGLWGIAVILGVLAGIVGLAFFGPTGRVVLIGFACEVTACSAAGMTVAGWLLIALPAASVAMVGLFWSRLGRAARVAVMLLVVPTVAAAYMFSPGRRTPFDDLLIGPGGGQFGDGIIWAVGALGVALAMWLIAAVVSSRVPVVNRRFRAIVAGITVVAVVLALPVAISRADPTYVRATEIFPTTITMNGDTLTRTMARDQRGCDRVLPDDDLLNRRNCFLTMHVGFTTDDSDAVVTFRAVLYRDDATADQVRDIVPDRTVPVGVTGDSITVMSTTREWLLIGTVAHADGRPISQPERGWVMWPLRQVSYYFIGSQVGLMVEPDPKDGIAPRTP
ncbi:hypothetical protein [Micromonospora sonneratiae]|uniref:Uncharacterized protein n=1 Tax=Micromonospora sonneratiae TaxID=1184706 RepID=A0ABW3YMH6_9ACTN